MKIIIRNTAIVLALSLVACKKETPVKPTLNKYEESNSARQNTSSKIVADGLKSLEVWQPEEISNFLKNNNEDTLYVTNFFATWCGPCVREIPEFKAKMDELKGQPVKFTFVSLDDKTDWPETVENFAEDRGIASNTVLLDGATLSPDFFATNFKTWKGETIPFTILRKGDKTEEIEGGISKEILNEKINLFK